MLTLVLVTDGANDEMAQAASLAYNMGVTVEVVDNMGVVVLTAIPQVDTADVLVDETVELTDPPSVETVTAPESLPVPADEPHPVLEREVVESTPETAEPVTPEG
jgi:hypothetical protein